MLVKPCIILIKILIFYWPLKNIKVNAIPKLHAKSWPPMKNYDIWETPNDDISLSSTTSISQENYRENYEFTKNSNVERIKEVQMQKKRQNYGKVLNFFPVPMDDECLSEDGRRAGTCLNVYECRQKGGKSKGECAMGFGVCCIFIASCDQEIKMNITYIVSPNFPDAMPTNLTSCKMKIKMISSDISQLRLDFHHFSLGQPNRKTGVCDGDIFQISGGLSGPFTLCGLNSGQHIYYDVGGRMTARQAMNSVISTTISLGNNNSFDKNPNKTTFPSSMMLDNITQTNGAAFMPDIEIFMNFTNRVIPTRLWEIRILQIPFSQRAPAGCLQYFTGTEGIIQTFNFADNGRHLAKQDYKACIQQAKEMCSITYEPCDDQSFRIGPTSRSVINDESPLQLNSTTEYNGILADMPLTMGTTANIGNNSASASSEAFMDQSSFTMSSNNATSPVVSSSTTPMPSTSSTPSSIPSSQSTTVEMTQTTPPTQSDDPLQDEEEQIEEGSGGNEQPSPSTRRPGSGGFDVLSFLSNMFDFRRRRRSSRQNRSFFTTCTDRITLPCIVEDFINAGMGAIPNCEPVHCGDQFCSQSQSTSCKIESTVTPFYLGIHFGDGIGKGSPEENIGACLRYSQMPCL